MRVRWSAQAADHLEDIIEFIRRESPENAPSFAQRLLDRVAALRDSPRIGRVIPEAEDAACRELLFGNYRITRRWR